MLSWQLVDCPKCGELKGKKCRSLTTHRVTDTHMIRYQTAQLPEYRASLDRSRWP